jgi:quinohemoprotein ethanol dehydrogenase
MNRFFPLFALVLVPGGAIQAQEALEWPSYGRDYGETRYSPLDQIGTDNVAELELAWTWDLQDSRGTQVTPLVSDGVMFLTGAWNVVFAVDARTGDLKWTWDPALARQGGPRIGANRGVALYEDKVYVGLADGRLVALDAETGQPVWSRQTTPYGVFEYNITGAPRVFGGKVIIGNGGAEYHGVRGFVTAYDAQTGEEAWRFYTVPGDPSEPFESPALEMAVETWAGTWWEYGGGGTAWDSFSYDPEANLVYIGTGNGAPWSHEWRSEGTGDNLFLNCIVAVDADTGELVWYYQTVPGDNWDYTTTMSMILADIVIDGRERSVLMTAPKNGFFYVLDRLTGELLGAEAIAHVTWASGIDMETGRPIETPEARYDTVGTWISPGGSAWGAHNWQPMSWHPDTGLAYIPGQETSTFYRLDPNYEPVLGAFSTGTIRGGTTVPEPDLGPPGFLLAWDPATMEERWRIRYDTPRNGGTLTAGENLLFSCKRDGWIYAHDATTGEKLWEFPIGENPISPITYSLDGRQYVSVVSGARDDENIPPRVWTFALGD